MSRHCYCDRRWRRRPIENSLDELPAACEAVLLATITDHEGPLVCLFQLGAHPRVEASSLFEALVQVLELFGAMHQLAEELLPLGV